jgi:plasmid stability protein
MSTLHVRNVPEPIYRALHRRAKERGSSVSAETIRLLGRALRVDRPGVRELLDQIERTRPVARKGAPGAAELIREDRDRR